MEAPVEVEENELGKADSRIEPEEKGRIHGHATAWVAKGYLLNR